MMQVNIKWWLFPIFAVISFALLSSFRMATTDIVHEVIIHHPGMKEKKRCQLIQRHGGMEDTLAFTMSVQSVICLDGQCKVVDVNLHWDRTGAYRSYSLASGVELEKKEGVPFTETNYKRLHAILKDEQSLFADFQLAEVVDLNKEDGGIDGISGATILTEEAATVKGATWTCYTLWHWANGDVRDSIRHITLHSTEKVEAAKMMASDQHSLRRLALQIYLSRGWYDEASLASVTKIFTSFDREETKLAIDYLTAAPMDIYNRHFYPLFDVGSSSQRLMLLKQLNKPESPIGGPDFVQSLARLRTYQEVDFVINSFSRSQIAFSKVPKALFPYLDHEDFLIARRVYWFLKTSDLTPQQRGKVVAFEAKNADRL